ncbi:MAG: di-trans,poly-cis-decaprenylcistransferase [Deltaproteobacteria bacterium RIFOXYA12_FULL_61_11]|nr:MAG: di-trans,poly-cis-decaprenylcistransferase [Deltaproteobacteria bacterium RIFOXYA12_FULL_61_11]
MPVDVQQVPAHLAIIMDGNGRWAQQRQLPRIRGHLRGMSTMRTIVRECSRIGIRYLTLYSFSTENWSRPQEEVSFLLSLMRTYAIKERAELQRNNVRVTTIGDLSPVPDETSRLVRDIIEATAGNTGLRLVIAFNYSGRAEILTATRTIARRVLEGELTPEEIDAPLFSKFLWTADLPDPDLMIRTSGEQRLSNFLLWQLAYSELYLTPVLWPDFDAVELHRALEAYGRRDRRYGALTDKRPTGKRRTKT